MRDFETYKDLLDSLKLLRRALMVKKAKHQSIIETGIPETRTPGAYEALNVMDRAAVQQLQNEVDRARMKFTPFARAVGGQERWSNVEFVRPMIKGALKAVGFDVVALAEAVDKAELALAAKKERIEAGGMRAEEMTPDEFRKLAADWNADREPAVENFEAAREKLTKAVSHLEMLERIEAAVKSRKAPLSGLTFSPGYAASVRRLAEFAIAEEFDSAFRLLESLPVRTRPTCKDREEIKMLAQEIVTSWNGKGLYNPRRNAGVAKEVVRIVRNGLQRSGRTVADFTDVEAVMSDIGILEYDVQAALYWLGLEAERRLLGKVPGIENEDFYNAGLIQQLDSVAEKRGPKLFRSLGYTLGFPFEIAFWNTGGKKSETHTGADMCIILYVMLEDGTKIIRGALMQGKLADKMVGNVHRSNETFGRNHQLISLTSGRAIGYYSFYHDPYDTIGISVVPADTVRKTIESRLTKKMKLWEIPPTECTVPTDKNATDFASFLAFTLMEAKHHFDSIEIALQTMGEGRKGYEKGSGTDVTKELASNLALISVGGPVPAKELELLAKYGFRETDEHAGRWAFSPEPR